MSGVLPLTPACSQGEPCALAVDLQRRLDVAQEGVRALAAETKNLLERAQTAERELEEKTQRCEDLEACLGAAQDGYALGIKASQRALSKLFASPVMAGARISPTLIIHTLKRLLPRTPQSSSLPPRG